MSQAAKRLRSAGSDSSQIQLRQALLLKLRVLVPAFFVPTAVSGVAIAVLDGSGGFHGVCLFLDGVSSH